MPREKMPRLNDPGDDWYIVCWRSTESFGRTDVWWMEQKLIAARPIGEKTPGIRLEMSAGPAGVRRL